MAKWVMLNTQRWEANRKVSAGTQHEQWMRGFQELFGEKPIRVLELPEGKTSYQLTQEAADWLRKNRTPAEILTRDILDRANFRELSIFEAATYRSTITGLPE